MSNKNQPLFGYVIGSAMTLSAVLLANATSGYSPFVNSIPPDKTVQSGYIAPSQLEVKCDDLDGDGAPETILKIGEEIYSLREVEGKPVLSVYGTK